MDLDSLLQTYLRNPAVQTYLRNPAAWGGVSVIIGGGWYIVQMLRGITKPNKVTWMVWVLMSLVVGFSFGFAGPNDIRWIVYATLGEIVLVALLCLKYGEKQPSDRTEKICIWLTVCALLVWAVLYFVLGARDSAKILLAIELLVCAYGALPTLKHAWYSPEEEGRGPWTFTLVGLVLGLIDAILAKDPHISFADDMLGARFEIWIYVLATLFVIDGPIAVVLLFRPGRVPRRRPAFVMGPPRSLDS